VVHMGPSHHHVAADTVFEPATVTAAVTVSTWTPTRCHVYATEGSADHTAILGRIGRTDPRDLPDVDTFGAEDSAGGRAVTGHDMFPDSGVGYLSRDATAQQTIARIIATGKP
jgi:hypothetical protein